MYNNLFIQSIDEFNYTSVVNFFNKEIYKDTPVLCLPGFEIMFYNFDKIIPSKLINPDNVLISSDVSVKQSAFNGLVEESKSYAKNFLTQSDVDMGGEHVYEFTFRSLSSEMLQRKQELYRPKEKDYELVKSKLSHISKKIVSINGRNLQGNRAFRNNTFFDLIKFLIEKDFYVVNCTIPNPCFTNIFGSDSYLEVEEKEVFNYSKNISYFLNSDCLIAVSDSAGITNHLCTGSNIILFGPGPCVNDVNFGADGKNEFQISKKIKPTFVATDFSAIHEILNHLNRPDKVKFFDESKIINF